MNRIIEQDENKAKVISETRFDRDFVDRMVEATDTILRNQIKPVYQELGDSLPSDVYLG